MDSSPVLPAAFGVKNVEKKSHSRNVMTKEIKRRYGGKMNHSVFTL
jgi:hypothetical protein